MRCVLTRTVPARSLCRPCPVLCTATRRPPGPRGVAHGGRDVACACGTDHHRRGCGEGEAEARDLLGVSGEPVGIGSPQRSGFLAGEGVDSTRYRVRLRLLEPVAERGEG